MYARKERQKLNMFYSSLSTLLKPRCARAFIARRREVHLQPRQKNACFKTKKLRYLSSGKNTTTWKTTRSCYDLPALSPVASPNPGIFSIFANSHSLLHNGQTFLVLSHRWMQSRWKTWPQQPNAIDRPASNAGDGFAWYSILGPCKGFLHMAHVSV